MGLDPAQVRARVVEPEIKHRLREYTEEAHTAGVISVPTLQIGERLFWGDDELELAAASA